MFRMSLFSALVFIHVYHAVKIVTRAEENGPEETSQRAVALINHAYKTVYSHNYPSCLMACMDDSQCRSLNYWWHTSQCELNNRTKYSADSKFFIWDVSSTYMGLMREPGI